MNILLSSLNILLISQLNNRRFDSAEVAGEMLKIKPNHNFTASWRKELIRIMKGSEVKLPFPSRSGHLHKGENYVV